LEGNILAHGCGKEPCSVGWTRVGAGFYGFEGYWLGAAGGEYVEKGYSD
jgi:hypothetical protein